MRRFQSIGILITLLILCLCLCAGCGGGSGSSTPSVTPTIVQPTAHQIPSSITPSAVSATSVTLPASTLYKVGDVIYSDVGSGLLRKVTAVMPSSGGAPIQYTTTPAALSDVFQQADLIVHKDFSSTDFPSTMTLPKGVRILPHHAKSRGDVVGFDIDASFYYPSEDASPCVHVSGTLAMTMSADIEIQIDMSGVKYVKFLPTITYTGTLAIEGTASFASVSIPIVPQTMLAIIPVCPGIAFTPSYSISSTLDGTLSIGGELDSTRTISCGHGLQYNRGSGWSTIAVANDDEQCAMPSFDGTLTATLDYCPLHQELDFDIDDIVGPYLAADLPDINFTAQAQTNPPGISLTISPSLSGTLGVKAAWMGHTLIDESASLSVDFPPKIFSFSFVAPIVTLTATPSTIASGQSVQLTWSSTNGSTVVSSNFSATTLSGSISVSPTQTTTYTITISGTGGTTTQTATVTVGNNGGVNLNVS